MPVLPIWLEEGPAADTMTNRPKVVALHALIVAFCPSRVAGWPPAGSGVRVGVWQHTRARTRTTSDIHCPPCRPGGGRRSSSTLIAKLIYGTALGHAEIAGRKGRQWPS